MLLFSWCSFQACWSGLCPQVRDCVRQQVRDSLRDGLRGRLHGTVLHHLRKEMRDQVRTSRGFFWRESNLNPIFQVRHHHWGEVWDNLRDDVRGSLRNCLRHRVRHKVWDRLRDRDWEEVWAEVSCHKISIIGPEWNIITRYEDVCKTEYETAYDTVIEQKCETQYETEYTTEFDTACETVYETKCEVRSQTNLLEPAKYNFMGFIGLPPPPPLSRTLPSDLPLINGTFVSTKCPSRFPKWSRRT